MNSRTLLWAIPLVLYLVFAWWYTNTEGPLTEQEIQRFMQELPTFGFEGERLERIRTFMENDTGRQFIMINNIDLNEDPPSVEGAPDGATASDLMGMYMEYMWPALLQRACHPIFMGVTVFDSMDIVGIENAEVWDQGALMRYRSRRDLFEIISNPEFQGRHDFKMAGLVKTIAYPVETRLYFSDPRLLLALILITLTSLLDLWIYGRRD